MWYWIFRWGSLLLLKTFFRLKVDGIENVPQKTNFIVVANHSSFLDPLVVAAAIPKKVHCIVSRGLFLVPLLKWSLERIEVIPTGRNSAKAIEFILHNRIVGLFPEGKCSRNGTLNEFRRGAALLSLKTGRPILPCAVIGAYEALPVSARFPKLVPIKVRIGKPVYLLREFEDVLDDARLQEGTHTIKLRVQELMNGR